MGPAAATVTTLDAAYEGGGQTDLASGERGEGDRGDFARRHPDGEDPLAHLAGGCSAERPGEQRQRDRAHHQREQEPAPAHPDASEAPGLDGQSSGQHQHGEGGIDRPRTVDGPSRHGKSNAYGSGEDDEGHEQRFEALGEPASQHPTHHLERMPSPWDQAAPDDAPARRCDRPATPMGGLISGSLPRTSRPDHPPSLSQQPSSTPAPVHAGIHPIWSPGGDATMAADIIWRRIQLPPMSVRGRPASRTSYGRPCSAD